MIEVNKFVESLQEAGVSFFTGVPDSLLKSFCAYVTDNCGKNHVIAANEGGAVGLVSGHYLATGNPALVYMQNSGQGNAVNPLASLADPDVYSIPMVLLVGWRGEPGVKDEPQHVKQGKVTVSLFETLGIPTEILPDDELAALDLTRKMVEKAKVESRPVALVVRKGLFAEYKLQNKMPDGTCGTPTIVSFYHSPYAQRKINDEGRLESISYLRESKYALYDLSPIWVPREWIDRYSVDAKGNILSFVRSRPDVYRSDDFASPGEMILSAYSSGTPKTTRRVEYFISPETKQLDYRLVGDEMHYRLGEYERKPGL